MPLTSSRSRPDHLSYNINPSDSNQNLTHSDQQSEDQEEYKLVKHYHQEEEEGEDSNISLPIHSSHSSPSPPQYSMSSFNNDSSPSSFPIQEKKRFAGGFDPYGRSNQETTNTPSLVVGEDKLQEKLGLSNGGNGSGGKGKYANLIPVQKPPTSPLQSLFRIVSNETFFLFLYTALSLITRLWRIGRSATVIWDEAHFGKFGSHYLKQEFYFDVHPPLGKMLVGLAGLLSGYRGQFEFKSGEAYPSDVNYVGMRIILAMFGVAMVPIAFSTTGALGWNWRARHFVTFMVLFDNAWLVISRFILLDSMLLFFTFTTTHGLVKLHQCRDRSFTDVWWFWMGFTGVSIGCVASVKWVGLFVTALVGLYTIEDLWNKFGDLRMPVRTYARHWCARILCLIVIPVAVYMASFKAHFMILNHSGPGDAQMSSLFQAHLRGNDFGNSPLEAAFGSKVTFKNMGYGGGLLHSHVQTYPVGSQQQQVTCYHYKDNNNEFIITPTWEDEDQLPEDFMNANSTHKIRMLKNGDTLRLVHAQTGRNLHSHTIAAPITKENYEVSGYGDSSIGDANDYWIVEVVDDTVLGKGLKGNHIRSLTTRIRFKHKLLGCYLRAANAVLPQWGWKQVEVSCDKVNNPADEHTYWNIESHWNERLPSGNAKFYRSPFLRDFIHLNVAMMTSNNALIPDADKEDILASSPYDWPWLWNGLRMNSWSDESVKYYLIGNPIIWWGSSASLLVFVGVLLYYLGRLQRRHVDLSPRDWEQFTYVGKVAGIGWFFHYLPFLMMGRVTYIHHYLPTLYFAVLMFGHLFDHFFWNDSTARYYSRKTKTRNPLSERTKNIIFLLAIGSTFGVFCWFNGTAFGMIGKITTKWQGMRWRKSWNIY